MVQAVLPMHSRRQSWAEPALDDQQHWRQSRREPV